MAMKAKRTIKGIDCYGTFLEDSNVIIIGTFANGEGFEDIWCNDTLETTWTGVVNELLPWAKRLNLTIDELGTC